MAKTNQSITIEFNGEVLVIPEGTAITHNTACGIDKKYNFINDFSWYKPELKGFARQMALHDMIHRGINIDPKFVTE